jgi:hypothetical protein
MHGEETIQEYDEVIDIEFTPQTPEGSTNMRRLYLLAEEKGYSREEAIFTLASDEVGKFLQLSVPQLRLAAQHELHVHVKRNGAISYRKLLDK